MMDADSLFPLTTLTTTIVRQPTFLHRNWLVAMGSRARPADTEDDYCHPAKRRRVARNSPDSGIGLEPLDAVSLGSDNTEAEKALRLTVLKIQHKDSSRVRNSSFIGPVPLADEVPEAKVRCRISIWGHEADGTEHHLLVDSQICAAKTYKNPAGPSHMTRLHLSQPFNVPQDKLLVPRETDGVLALAGRYSAWVSLEPAGDAAWPPSFLRGTSTWQKGVEDTPRCKWILHGKINDLFEWHRKNIPLALEKRPCHSLPTDYVLDVDVRWASLLSAKAMKRLGRGVQDSIVCFGDAGDRMDLDTPSVCGINEVNGHANGFNATSNRNAVDDTHVNGDVDLTDDVDDQAEGELTPGRRRRPRPQINYNLKLLSDKAQHRERRRRQGQKSRNGAADSADDRGVTYLYREEFLRSADDFNCTLCGKPHPDFDVLCLHYKLLHADYACEFNKNPRKISLSRSFGRPGTVFAPGEYQLGPPQGPLDPQAILEGDESWITSRQGSESDREVNPYRTVAPRAAPDKARILDDGNPLPLGHPKRVTVPKTKTTLYHPLSKAPLEPGTQIDRYVADERWLMHKHRDTLGDYTDLEPREIEFMQMWDSYFLPLHLTSELFLPPHYLAFTREKADWIAEDRGRGIEFAKHTVVLRIRGVIEDQHVTAASALIQEANDRREEREKASAGQAEVPRLEQPPPRKTDSGCARCGKFVERGPALLKCSGKDCPAPLWHDYCATENLAETNKRATWMCNTCCKKEYGSL